MANSGRRNASASRRRSLDDADCYRYLPPATTPARGACLPPAARPYHRTYSIPAPCRAWLAVDDRRTTRIGLRVRHAFSRDTSRYGTNSTTKRHHALLPTTPVRRDGPYRIWRTTPTLQLPRLHAPAAHQHLPVGRGHGRALRFLSRLRRVKTTEGRTLQAGGVCCAHCIRISYLNSMDGLVVCTTRAARTHMGSPAAIKAGRTTRRDFRRH